MTVCDDVRHRWLDDECQSQSERMSTGVRKAQAAVRGVSKELRCKQGRGRKQEKVGLCAGDSVEPTTANVSLLYCFPTLQRACCYKIPHSSAFILHRGCFLL